MTISLLEVVTSGRKHLTPEMATEMMQCSGAFSGMPLASIEERELVSSAIARMKEPAPAKWVAARVLILLKHYFDPRDADTIVEGMAADWGAILSPYPAWAIAKACIWWLGMDNPRNAFRPKPGEIQARAHEEMMRIRAAEIMISRPIRKLDAAPPREYVVANAEDRRDVASKIIGGLSENWKMAGVRA